MATKYMTPSVEAILEESSEDQAMRELKPEGSADKRRRWKAAYDTAMKVDTSRGRDRSRKEHKPGSKHTHKGKGKNVRKRATGSSRDDYWEPRTYHRHRHSDRSLSSASLSDEEEPAEDHMAVRAARARLSSPSMISTFTTQTTATNKSSSSSGSNSTVTQASVSKRSHVGNKSDVREAGYAPLSLAVPDPPDVFQFLDAEEPAESEKDEEAKDEEADESGREEVPQWQPKPVAGPYVESDPERDHATSSSTASSSFHGDENFSEIAVDNDTDRSSSPERSEHDQDNTDEAPPTDHASATIASQVAAAQGSPNIHGSMQQLRTPNMTPSPHGLPSAVGGQYQHHVQQRQPPRVGTLPVTGYELLALKLSFSATRNDTAPQIQPIYRKFEALNHRLLLHLQDELSELEEQLQHLDHADTQSRVVDAHGHIAPASRRLAAYAGGELEWRKTDVLGRIGYKLAQYNQALASFQSTQSLAPPDMEDVAHYRAYLRTEQPIAEGETRFLDPVDDLVSVSLERRSHSGPSVSSLFSDSSSTSSFLLPPLIPNRHTDPLSDSTPNLNPTAEPLLPLITALATSVLLPLFAFTVIPGFVGRMAVAALVAVFVLAVLGQTEALGAGPSLGLGRAREGLWCVAAWAGVLAVLAAVI
ncbi:hypothetical protein QTJ16_001882 [Diplocarpon rosae]|uniref:DUF6594 domain-containing protein n=1 Tax=Diplocarpon rosae TaxID=946125 RepID=A0AAD9T553_9HELO|nr:hypothetical protein QTJ16_001882 [Diplocarpon rosae]PBP21108.1 hypothetical protein BUE80_DR008025 [Diplocarpon rosae]